MTEKVEAELTKQGSLQPRDKTKTWGGDKTEREQVKILAAAYIHIQTARQLADPTNAGRLVEAGESLLSAHTDRQLEREEV